MVRIGIRFRFVFIVFLKLISMMLKKLYINLINLEGERWLFNYNMVIKVLNIGVVVFKIVSIFDCKCRLV